MPMTADGLDVQGIGSLLQRRFLSVPSNQRSYSWESEHVQDYWNDILHAMDSEDGTDYFIGSVVLSRGEGTALEVVDGQQRLATTMIIIGAVRDYMQLNGHHEHADVLEKYLSDKDEDTLETLPKLSLNLDDGEFFRKHVVERSPDGKRQDPFAADPRHRPKESHRRIIDARKEIRDAVWNQVEGKRPNEAVARLRRLHKYLRESVKVISVEVPNHESAYTIFETLNDRGLDLSKADLLKNHIYRTAGNKLEVAQSRWSAMVAAIETVSKEDITVDYIRYLWISENGLAREKELYSKLRKAIISQAQALSFAESLADNAVLYAAILNSDHEQWSQSGGGGKG